MNCVLGVREEEKEAPERKRMGEGEKGREGKEEEEREGGRYALLFSV